MGREDKAVYRRHAVLGEGFNVFLYLFRQRNLIGVGQGVAASQP